METPPVIPVFPVHTIQYNTNAVYRQVFRQITEMDVSKYVDDVQNLPNMDEETLDEYNFDELRVSAFMDKVADATLHNDAFVYIYELAAAKMFSTDCQIGIAVLCSYDFLYLFYPMLCSYSQSPQTFSQNDPNYVKLVKKLL